MNTTSLSKSRLERMHQVLTSRMGFGSVMAMPDTYPVQKLIREYRIGGDGPMLVQTARRAKRVLNPGAST